MKRNPTVLLVDDSENDLLLLETAFDKARFESQLAKVYDGEQAIAYLTGEGSFGNRAKHPLPSAVLLDLNMPKTNGFEVLKWVRGVRGQDLKRIPFIVLTASLRLEDVELASELGADAFLIKPASLQDLVFMVQTLGQWLRINQFPPQNDWVRGG